MTTPADHDKGHLGALFAGPSPQWAGRERFVWLTTGFGHGERFLAIWRAWRADPHRCERLHVIAVDVGGCGRLRVDRSDELAARLAAALPPATPDLHRLSFEGGRVQLLLVLGAVVDKLPSLLARVDRFDIEGRFVEGARPRVFKALARLAAEQAVLVVHGADRTLADGALRSAGFVAEPETPCAALDPSMPSDALPSGTRPVVSRYAPAFTPRQAPSRLASHDAVWPRHALIVGSGLAGCAAAWALAEQGWTSTIVDRHQGIARETSGQHAGLFHGIVTPQDGAHSRFNRMAALEVARWIGEHETCGRVSGLLRLASVTTVDAMRRTLAALSLPADYVQAVDAETASAISGLALEHPAWFYPGGGWARPAGLARSFFEAAEAQAVHATVASLQRRDDRWRLLDDEGEVIGDAATVVWATGGDMPRLVDATRWPVARVRGQTTLVAADTPGLVVPRLPIAGLGYALPVIDDKLMCGATVHDGDEAPMLRAEDQRHNLEQLQRLTGSSLTMEDIELDGRVGWRAVTPDRLPIIGGWPDTRAVATMNRQPDHPQQVPRLEGLYLLTGFASRGITWSALAAQTLASMVTGSPCPLPADLLDAVDAGRFTARAGRRGT